MRRVILAICATAVGLVLLLSFKTETQSPLGASPASAIGSATPGTGAGAASTSPGSSSPSSAAAQSTGTAKATGTASPGASASTPATGAARTVTGASWETIYGPVQVKITVSGGKVTAASAVVYPQETPRDQQINSYAIPELNSEAVAASSAKIDTVSGATYTSGGYIGSLQSALDKAGL